MDEVVSVPVLGIIFLSIMCVIAVYKKGFELFPSPYWGLFFYHFNHGKSINRCS